MFVSTISTLCSILCVALAQTQTPSASFAYPLKVAGNPSLITINHIDTIVVEWTANFSPVYLLLFCNMGTADTPINSIWASFSINGSTTTKLYSPDNVVVQDWARPFDCHFDLNYDSVVGKGINGPHMNITSVANFSATTYPLSRSATISLSSIAPSNTPTSSATPTSAANQPTSSSDDNNGLSIGAKEGISIGAVAGCMVLTALAFTIWRYKRKLQRLQSGHSDVYQHHAAAELEPRATAELEPQAKVELESWDAPQELHGSDVVVGQPRLRGV